MTTQTTKRYFEVEYCKAEGGQVFKQWCDFDGIRETGDALRNLGNRILGIREIK